MKTNIPIQKQKAFIEQFEKVRPDYVEYASLLEKILTRAVDKMASLALVQTRAKAVSSFSGKIISKDKYLNPLTDMTDLCGARVIVHFKSHVDKICSFIRENFEIDEVNSLDARSMLRVSEFGYRSIHYIVTPKMDSILDVQVAEKFKSMKAEIQVRTLAEHVWADISHDRIYKTDLNIPEEWRRQAARLSAILEDADIEFGSMAREIDSLSRVYELQLENEKAIVEIEKLKTLISVQETDIGECAKNVLKLSTVYRAMNNFTDSTTLLKTWLDKPENPLINARLWFECGLASCLKECGEINTTGYFDGMKAIEHSLSLFENLPADVQEEHREELSYIYFRLGSLYQQNPEKSNESLDYIGKAHRLMPDNPLCFVAMMECIVMRNIDMAHYSISLFKAGMESAIEKLKVLIEIGLEKVPGWFAIGHCYFLLGDETSCISAYSHAIGTLLNGKYLTSQAAIAAEIALAGRLKRFDPALAGQVQLYLHIAMVLSSQCFEKTRYTNYLRNFQIRKDPFKTPVVIVAGGASLMDEAKVDDYREYIREIMHDFRGTIISGGTTAGIPGLAGMIKAELGKQHQRDFDLIAWLPKSLPGDAVKSVAYDQFYETPSGKFSALDILNCWTDLITNGVDPHDVVLVGIDGGDIASMEYKIAISLGARVALVAYSGRAVTDILRDKALGNHPNLLPLPDDPLTLWAMVNQKAATTLTIDEIATLAPLVHEFYRKKKLEELDPKSVDVNKYKVLMPWDKLDASLQNSNLKQVAFYEHILKRVNLGIRKASSPALFNIKENVTAAEYDLAASLEHARWNAERLLDGWKYGPQKDLVNKLNQYIVSWDKLDAATRRYDYEPVDNIPVLLAKIGFEVYKI
ncbi:MAG: RyR domain-containing protein [Bacteroidota bacterium]